MVKCTAMVDWITGLTRGTLHGGSIVLWKVATLKGPVIHGL